MDLRKCIICNEEHDYQSGFFSRHLKNVHSISLEDYIILSEYSNIEPKCNCGYCNDKPSFYRGSFLKFKSGHNSFKWLEKQYINKYGKPICNCGCGKNVKFYRGIPRKYYNLKHKPGIWNQNKIQHALKYKDTDLYYQSSYEEDFLKLCESLNILNKLENGKTYKYPDKYRDIGLKLTTDFSLNDIEIEIKSNYILKKQGGMRVLNAKRKTVESNGKKYILILNKDYSEFLEELKCS